ncbi:MAG TPA: LytTR family DNA-binding domain-containing protein [Blastocatellia bacterium]|nr:LytTR family DNA-binding domain-containing protein [Blastocatellia bacterium]
MAQTIRPLIVDDEPLARRRLRNLLRGRNEFSLVGECANGREAVSAIEQRGPELVFLDVQMPDLDGFGVLKSLPAERLPVIVFVTAFDQYAVRAFEFHALDYLLKPFDDERFEQTLERAARQVRQHKLQGLGAQLQALLADYQGRRSDRMPPASRLIVRSAGRISFIPTDEIDWIEAEGCYARLHTGERSHLLRETLSHLEARLDPQRFLHIHRSTIINLARLRELQPHSHGEYTVILSNGTHLRLSHSCRDKLQLLLGSEL